MTISYSPESVQDLFRLREFIEEKNPIAAERISGELLAGINKLKIFPKIGLPVRRAPDPEVIRDLFVNHYTVRYLLGRYDITILRVWHSKEIEKDL